MTTEPIETNTKDDIAENIPSDDDIDDDYNLDQVIFQLYKNITL